MLFKKNKVIKIFILSILLAGTLSFGHSAKAAEASLYFAPSAGTYPIGSTIDTVIKINSGTDTINSAEGSLNFDATKLEVADVSVGGSIFNLWLPSKPTFSNTRGTVSFSGGLPQPGYKGSAGTVLVIKFKAKAAGDAQVLFTSGAILANDGKGSNILTAMGNASYKISPESIPPKPDENASAPQSGANANLNAQKNPDTSQPAAASASAGTISSPTHPDQSAWYSSTTAVLSWALPENAEAISYSLDNNINSAPALTSQAPIVTKTFEKLKDGVWYFHLKIKDKSGWSQTYNYRVQIDTTPPSSLETYVEQKDLANWPTLYFKTKDSGSGISKYEIKIGSLEDRAYEVGPNEASFTASGLTAGDHAALVKAIDKAGNATISEVDFNIKPIDTPGIGYFPSELKSSDKLFFSGKALPDIIVHLFVRDENGKITTKETRSDNDGDWYLLFDSSLPNGRYVAWVEAENANGLRSDPSAKVSFLVTPPVFAKLGNLVINYFTVLVSLLFMIILIVFAVIFLISFARKKLKKETIEIEKVLNDKLAELKTEVENEFTELSKLETSQATKTARIRAKTRLNGKIELAGKKILKEVKDVEDIIR